MIKMKKCVSVLILGCFACSLFLTGCGSKDKKQEETETESSSATEMTVEEKDYLSVQTSIAYSSGDTKNWTYGNQRKEFPNNESCYVRIGSIAITSGAFGKGNGDAIEVTYRFTGTENCKIELSDGKAEEILSDDSNVKEFVHTVTAAKEKKAEEDIMIFRYSPNDAESVVLEVLYDDQVAEKFDELNTVYFDKVDNSQKGTH